MRIEGVTHLLETGLLIAGGFFSQKGVPTVAKSLNRTYVRLTNNKCVYPNIPGLPEDRHLPVARGGEEPSEGVFLNGVSTVA